VHRLYHADAATLVKEFSAVVDPHRIRLVAYPTGNAVVVAGPPSAQEAMAYLIARIDAASAASAGSARPSGDVGQTPVPPRNSAARAAETGKSAHPAGNQEDVIRVVRIPSGDLSALARALSEVARARSSTAVRNVVVTPSGGEEPAQKPSLPAETHQR
jgi:type II secretory pathway component GspD/PulD (secretin)